MNVFRLILVIGLIGGLGLSLAGAPVEQVLEPVFTELRTLKPMEPGQKYTVTVAGHPETGSGDSFLRRRTGAEVATSGLSCGCGDYALLFIERIEPRGFKTLLVDGAEISSSSLEWHFSGHAVVAIRDQQAPADAPWWLIDSTNLKVIARKWSPAEKSFQAFGHVFWIGYCGTLADYPITGPDELKAFYTRTLASVPLEFFNRTLPRLKFTIDPSLKGPDGKYLNPRLEAFLHLQEKILSTYHIQSEREVSILLTCGRDDSSANLDYSESDGWVSQLGLKSACSPSLLSYYENASRPRGPAAAPRKTGDGG